MWRYRIIRWTRLFFLFLIFIALIAPEWPPFGDKEYQLEVLVGQRQFNFVAWEIEAFQAKAAVIVTGSPRYLAVDARQETVLRYLDLVQQAGRLEEEIHQIYTDPDVADPNAQSAELRARLQTIRAELATIQDVAEAIMQEQVAAVLVDEGFGVLGQAWPPVMIHVTPLPSLLIVSPRDRIEQIHAISLVHGLTTAEKEALETAVFQHLDLSALVVPIGGMATYPAMVMEAGSVNWLAEVAAHEWVHHWLSFRPLGWTYGDPQVRTINETVASLVDVEIRDQVIARYYPAFALPPPTSSPANPEPAPEAEAPKPIFDFRAEMRETRVRVEDLLATDKIEEAEGYMEQRRLLFVENGYPIRKLNQAYFAFYGAYAAEPGAAGDDPIGPMLRDVRAASPSLRAFLERVAPINSFAELEAIWEDTAVD